MKINLLTQVTFYIFSITWVKYQLKRQRQLKIGLSISLNNCIVIDIFLEVVLKMILIYKINQTEFVAIHVTISKYQIKKNQRCVWLYKKDPKF